MKTVEFYWKPITEIPTKHWSKNNAIFLLKLTNRCGTIIPEYEEIRRKAIV